MDQRIVFFAPVLVVLGIAGIVEPRIFLTRTENQPAIFKVLQVVVMLIGAGIALYIRTIVFKDWHER